MKIVKNLQKHVINYKDVRYKKFEQFLKKNKKQQKKLIIYYIYLKLWCKNK